jgi:uncharacterized integral membrane protein
MNKRSLASYLLISLVIGVLVFIFMIHNQQVVEIDFYIVSVSEEIGVWIIAALVLGSLLGLTNRSTSVSGRVKSASSGIRYESTSKLFGLPIVSIASGPYPERNEDRGLAIGIIAIGDISLGVLSFGGIACGVISAGGASFGLVSFGGLSIGIIAIGGAAIGLLAAVGGLAIGYNVVGEVGIGIQHFEDAQVHILDLLTL